MREKVVRENEYAESPMLSVRVCVVDRSGRRQISQELAQSLKYSYHYLDNLLLLLQILYRLFLLVAKMIGD